MATRSVRANATTTPVALGRITSRALPWIAPLLAAFALRLIVWRVLPYHLPNPVPISDEGEYRAAAIWLAQGRNFSFFRDWIWTRPPLYVLFLAAHIKLFGPLSVAPIRLSQALISTATVGIVMAWAWRLAPPARARPVALLTGWAMALSYSLASFSFLLLSETLFITLLFGALLALTIWAQQRGWRWLIGGAVLLGLGSLTRAVLAGALPLVALWVWWTAAQRPAMARYGRRRWLRSLAAPLLLTAVVSALILPWSVYNTRFYGAKHLILIDTTGGYNALYGATRDQIAVHDQLITIPDQSERQNAAYRKAWEVARANPRAFGAKTLHELLDLLLINFGGIERLYKGYASGATPIPHLLGLASDDLLYVVTAPLAVLGLFRRQRRAGKALAIIWLGYNLVTGPLFFAINRFRLPLLPILFVYAACAMQWRNGGRWAGNRVLAGLLSGGLALLLLSSFTWWTPGSSVGACDGDLCQLTTGISARLVNGECDRAWSLLNSGDLAGAQATIDAGSARKPLTCFAILQARIDQRQGNPGAALALLHISADPDASLNSAHVLLTEGDILRTEGDLNGARDRFVARQVELENDLDWAWNYLQPPATRRIDIGNGLDPGLIAGFAGREYTDKNDYWGTGFRWTEPDARLRFPRAGTGQPQRLRLLANGFRPPGEAAATVRVSVDDRAVGQTVVTPDWHTLDFEVPATPAGQDVIITLRSTFFVPDPHDAPADHPLRMRGIELRRAELLDPAR